MLTRKAIKNAGRFTLSDGHEGLCLYMQKKLTMAISAKLTGKVERFDFLINGEKVLTSKNAGPGDPLEVLNSCNLDYTILDAFPDHDVILYDMPFLGSDPYMLQQTYQAVFENDTLIRRDHDALCQFLSGWLSEYQSEVEDFELLVEEAAMFAESLDDALRGRFKEALRDDNVVNLIDSSMKIFSCLTKNEVLENLRFILPGIFGCGERSRTVLLSSKELCVYDSYKKNLPEDIRRRADDMIYLYHHPFCKNHEGKVVKKRWRRDGEEFFFYLVVTEGYDTLCNPLYEFALKFVSDGLPELRKTFGTCISTSRSFFVKGGA